MHRVIGRNARPALIGEYPSTCCRYSETKNHIPNVAPPTSRTTRFDGAERARAVDPQRHQRRLREPALDPHEHHEQRDPGAIRPRVPRSAPAVRVGAHDPQDEQRQPDGGAERAARGRSCGVALGVAALGDEALREDRGGEPDRDVDEQDPAPPEQVGENAAEQHAGGTAGATHCAPDADGAVARRALLEGRGEDRQGGRGDHGAAEALDRARGDQLKLDWASPPASDATPNRTSPDTNTRRRPSRSAARPPSRRNPANVTV